MSDTLTPGIGATLEVLPTSFDCGDLNEQAYLLLTNTFTLAMSGEVTEDIEEARVGLQICAKVNDPNQHSLIVAHENRIVIGALLARHQQAGAEAPAKIQFFAVKPGQRGRGLGTTILDFSERYLRLNGADRVILNPQDKPRVKNFYLARGYKPTKQPKIHEEYEHFTKKL